LVSLKNLIKPLYFSVEVNSMRHFSAPRFPTLFLTAILLALSPCASRAQDASRPPSSEQTDDVVRIKTELVQTDAMVFDKQGRFV